MSEYTLSLFDPNTLLPHRAGIAGLALALSVLDSNDAPLSWDVIEDSIQLTWEGLDRDAVKWLLDHTYRIKNGYLDAPALKLDPQSSYTFTRGITASFLQHSQQRKFAETTAPLTFQVEEGQPEIKVDFRELLSCYYTGDIWTLDIFGFVASKIHPLAKDV